MSCFLSFGLVLLVFVFILFFERIISHFPPHILPRDEASERSRTDDQSSHPVGSDSGKKRSWGSVSRHDRLVMKPRPERYQCDGGLSTTTGDRQIGLMWFGNDNYRGQTQGEFPKTNFTTSEIVLILTPVPMSGGIIRRRDKGRNYENKVPITWLVLAVDVYFPYFLPCFIFSKPE